MKGHEHAKLKALGSCQGYFTTPPETDRENQCQTGESRLCKSCGLLYFVLPVTITIKPHVS